MAIDPSKNPKKNVVAFNGADPSAPLVLKGFGVVIASGKSNTIRGNSIFDNKGRGIDLGDDSFTLNDPAPGHEAGTGTFSFKQDYPVIVGASGTPATGMTFTWQLESLPALEYYIDFYSNSTRDPSGFGPGKTYLRTSKVTTKADGTVVWNEAFGKDDTWVSATATCKSTGDTSEFSMVDTDADGLADMWEIQGIDVNEDGDGTPGNAGIDLTLPDADPLHKNLYVEVDAMKSYVPNGAALTAVETSFAKAPGVLVHNPDGKDGIKLHAGPVDDTDIPDANWAGPWAEFDAVKGNVAAGYGFGTDAERADKNWPNILSAKQLAYRYCIFAKQQGPGNDSSGLAEGIPGNDFMVTLGLWTTPGGTQDQQAGTFMHELGHTLGLWHGGNNNQNFKPNYHSVMNYLWQVPHGKADQPAGSLSYGPWFLDYSTRAYADLDETAVDENVSIGGDAAYTVGLGGNPWNPVAVVSEAVAPGGYTDYNGNGKNDGKLGARDLNGDGAQTKLTGYEDWSHLQYYVRELENFTDGVHGAGTGLAEAGEAELTGGTAPSGISAFAGTQTGDAPMFRTGDSGLPSQAQGDAVMPRIAPKAIVTPVSIADSAGASGTPLGLVIPDQLSSDDGNNDICGYPILYDRDNHGRTTAPGSTEWMRDGEGVMIDKSRRYDPVPLARIPLSDLTKERIVDWLMAEGIGDIYSGLRFLGGIGSIGRHRARVWCGVDNQKAPDSRETEWLARFNNWTLYLDS